MMALEEFFGNSPVVNREGAVAGTGAAALDVLRILEPDAREEIGCGDSASFFTRRAFEKGAPRVPGAEASN